MDAGRLIIVSGLPGSGKTTAARKLAAERRGIRLSPDEWMAALGGSLWDGALRERVEALQWTLAKDLLDVGLTAIIEWGTWTRAERDRLRGGARALGAAVELVLLDAPVDELWRRVEARAMEQPPITRADVELWASAFERPGAAELALYDSPPE